MFVYYQDSLLASQLFNSANGCTSTDELTVNAPVKCIFLILHCCVCSF